MNTIAAFGVAVLLLSQQAVRAPDAGATIRGRVFDADGRPMAGVSVRPAAVDPEIRFVAGSSTPTTSDGRFAITGLPPGSILVVAHPQMSMARRTPHPPVYFPGVLARTDAWPVDVGMGETIELDIHIPPVFVASIKVVIAGPDGYALDRVRVMRPEANEIKNVNISDNGIGFVDSLREARYVVAARGRAGDTPVAAWRIVNLVPGEIELPLLLEPAATVTGRIIAERGGLPPVAGTRVVAAWTENGVELDPLSTDHADVGPDGAFTIDGVFGTRMFRVAGLPAEWEVTALRADRSDITLTGTHLDPGSTTELTIVVSKK